MTPRYASRSSVHWFASCTHCVMLRTCGRPEHASACAHPRSHAVCTGRGTTKAVARCRPMVTSMTRDIHARRASRVALGPRRRAPAARWPPCCPPSTAAARATGPRRLETCGPRAPRPAPHCQADARPATHAPCRRASPSIGRRRRRVRFTRSHSMAHHAEPPGRRRGTVRACVRQPRPTVLAAVDVPTLGEPAQDSDGADGERVAREAEAVLKEHGGAQATLGEG